MRRTDRITGLLIVLFGGWIVYLSSNMSIQRGGVPGPGLLPIVSGALLVLFGAILVARPSEPGVAVDWPLRDDGIRVVGTLVALAIFTAVIPYLGFTLTTFLLLSILIWWWSEYAIWKSGVIGAGIALSMMVIFQALLGAPLPVGFWG